MTPFDTPILFDELAGFTPTIRPLADGIRASTAARCVSCAVIEYLDPHDDRLFGSFNQGVATMGHLLHQAWAFQVFKGKRFEIETAIPWKHGVSHDDVTVFDGPWAGVYEVKTHSEPKPKPPSAENQAQVRLRMRLRELAGLEAPGPTRLVMIGKAGRESGWARGPWEVTLADADRDEIDAKLAVIDTLMARVASLDLHADADLKANGCTTCFPLPRVEATVSASDLIDAALAAQEQLKPAKATYDEKRAALKDLGLEPGRVYEAIQGDLSVSKTGRMTITRRYDAPAENFATAPF